MVARYWGPGGNGLWSSTTNWSASATGTPTGASVPGTGDTVLFNASSGAGTATLDINATIQTLTMTGFTGTLAFGTNTITVTATGNVFVGATTYSVSGTPVINVNNATATAATINPSATTEANAVSFVIQSGSYALILSSGGSVKNLTTTSGFTGSLASAGSTYGLTIYGNVSLSSTTTFSGTAPTVNGYVFAATSAKTVTTNGVTWVGLVTVDGVGGSLQLQDAFTQVATSTFTLTNGTLDLNGKVLTVGNFSSSNANTRAISFGTGSITVSGSNAWLTSTVTGLTISATAGTDPTVTFSYSGASTCTFASGPLSEANSISIVVAPTTTATYQLNLLGTSNFAVRNITFGANFSGTWSGANGGFCYGGLTLNSTMTLSAFPGLLTFASTSATVRTITTAGKTIDGAITFAGVGGTWQLQDAMTVGVTRTVTLTSGTLDLNSKTLTTGLFATTNSNARTLAFNTSGIITCNGAGGTLFTAATSTNLTVTGTPTVNISYSGATAVTVAGGNPTEANTLSFNITAGTYTLTMFSTNRNYRDVDFTGFSGTLAAVGSAVLVYGSLTLSSTMTLSTGATLTMASTSATVRKIKTNGKSVSFAILFNGVGGTWQLQDNMTMLTQTISHANGTFDLNGYTLSTDVSYITVAGTKNLTFNGGTFTTSMATASGPGFNNNVPTGFSTTAGTGVGKIRFTSPIAKNMVGGGSVFNCTLYNDAAAALTITGANTFNDIDKGNPTTAFVFPAGATTTVNNFSLTGSVGNIVTITSSTPGVAATLSKASGVVSSDYMSIQDSAAGGGATWYAGTHSTNVSGNTGWIFTAPPAATADGKFFLMF